MRIVKIEIEEFGKLSDRLFLFGEGMNLIEGPNESGKSTLLAFIRFALYGFPRKAGVNAEEREKRLSWHTGRAAGRLFLRTEAGDFCIFRSVVRQGSATRDCFNETLCVTALPSGAEVALDGKAPGEYFLGLPAMLYDSTLCLRQSDVARVSDPAVGEALNELLFAGGGGVGADVAVEKLRLARRDLQHLKGRGGRIADLEDRIAIVQDALLRAREDSGELSALRADAARYRVQVQERRRELEDVTAKLEAVSAAEALALFDRAHAAQAVCDQKRASYEALCEKNEAIAALPQVIADTREALRERESAAMECLRALPELERARAVRHDEKMLQANALLAEKGGAQAVLADFRRSQKKKKRAVKFSCYALLCALLFAAVTYLIASGILVPLLNLFLPAGTYLPGICVIGAGLCALCLLLMLAAFWRVCRFGKRIRKWKKRLGVRDVRMFRTYLEQCANEAQEAEAHHAQLSALEENYAEKGALAAQAEARVRECLFEGGLTVPEEISAIPALLAECETHYRGAQEILLSAKGEWERAVAARDALEKLLEGKNEAELRARFAEAQGAEPEELYRKQTFLRETLAGLEKKCNETERREVALAATAQDPSAQEGELSSLRTEYRLAKRRLSALEMAISAMEEATRTLGEGLVPQICERASEHLCTLTGGVYSKIYAGADLAVSLDSDKGPLPLSHFSAGCRDAAHLSLRMGVLDTLSQERLPLLFDEAFSRLDDERARGLLQLLLEYCRDGGQCLLFTCHRREAEMLGAQEFTYFELQ